MPDAPHFRVVRSSAGSPARCGELITRHGGLPTPSFMPVASQGTVRTLTPEDLHGIGVGIILSNTYHLYLRPGIEVVERLGGLHRFMAWDGPILTDSGGYQVFSLSGLRTISDEGVVFRSHIDGTEHFLTPELAVEYQERLGSDIMMALDECPPHTGDIGVVRGAMERTHRWAERCLARQTEGGAYLYGIVQGGTFPELRRESARVLAGMEFPGYGIGGLSLGEAKGLTWEMVEEAAAWLPTGKPRYLMGVGSPDDIVRGVARGIDLFDCALPTRVARNGALFTATGRRNIRNSEFRLKDETVDPGCDCLTCRTFSAAYLHHLFKGEELLAYRLATIHNLRFVVRLMERIRDEISRDTFSSFQREFEACYQPTDEELRLSQKRRWLGKGR